MFNSEVYKQIDGAPMGAPVSPILAEIFLSFCEEEYLENCPTEFKPVMYRRYVDDTFLLFKNADHISKFHNYVNNFHSSLSFTCEKEVGEQLSFLDIKITKNGKNFETDLYRKPTFSGLLTKFDSSQKKQYKLNLISCLVDRAWKICSSYTAFSKELTNLKALFYMNNYPVSVVEKQISKKIQSLRRNKLLNLTAPKKILYVSFPYISLNSNLKIETEIRELVQRFFPHLKLRISFKNSLNVASFFNFKDKLPFSVRSSVVYTYQCDRCPAVYCGETARHLKARIAEHRGISARTGHPFLNPPNSNIYNHFLSTGHEVLPNNFKISFSTDSHNLKISESIFINKIKPSLNNMATSTPLNIHD